jgi:predicted regulator of Ras-like GTPase activity (Roadblock/LC7/MglB family)
VEDILKTITLVAGVSGCMLCDDEGDVLAHDLPGLVRGFAHSVVGYTAAQTLAGLKQAKRRKLGDIDLLFQDGRVLIKPLRRGFLCILCQQRISLPLLNLTADVAIRKLQERLKEGAPQRAPRSEKLVVTPQSGPLEPYASARERLLANFLRPLNKE